MPEFDDDYSDDQDDQSQDDGFVRLSRDDLKALRKKARMADDSPKLQREVAFLKAGINTEDPKMKYFVKGYEGDLTGEAVKAAAIEAGLMAPPQEQIPAEELRQHQQMANASAGGDGNTNEPDLVELLNNSKSADDVMRILNEKAPQVPTTWNRP